MPFIPYIIAVITSPNISTLPLAIYVVGLIYGYLLFDNVISLYVVLCLSVSDWNDRNDAIFWSLDIDCLSVGVYKCSNNSSIYYLCFPIFFLFGESWI